MCLFLADAVVNSPDWAVAALDIQGDSEGIQLPRSEHLNNVGSSLL